MCVFKMIILKMIYVCSVLIKRINAIIIIVKMQIMEFIWI